jgi:hypothetical protein
MQPDDPLNWHASPMSVDTDQNVELLGSPGRPSTWRGCPVAPAPTLPKVIISEIMYHPHDEITYREKHKFIEIYNTETFSVDVTGWRLASEGGVRFDFPSFVLNPLSFQLVVADLPSFLAIYPNVDQTRIISSYSGEFSNGGDRVALVDSQYNSIQFLKYDDQFPWPIGADDQENPFNTSAFVQFYDIVMVHHVVVSRWQRTMVSRFRQAQECNSGVQILGTPEVYSHGGFKATLKQKHFILRVD